MCCVGERYKCTVTDQEERMGLLVVEYTVFQYTEVAKTVPLGARLCVLFQNFERTRNGAEKYERTM